jgi:predicted amidophosphoribosyltransferase
MMKYSVNRNGFLASDVNAFFHCDYIKYRAANNPDFIVELKNNFNNNSEFTLEQAQRKLASLLQSDLPKVAKVMGWIKPTVCVMPRSKVHAHYGQNQLGFVKTVAAALAEMSNFVDGSDYIVRKINTRTTHLSTSNGGADPYVGITKDTCVISDQVKGKQIILVDDIYTRSVNIDEDAIQALLDCGAASVCLYTVARTLFRKNPEPAQFVA